MTTFIAGLDVAQSPDYTALAIVEAERIKGELSLEVRYLERLRGMDYPAQVRHVEQVLSYPALAECTLVIDATGVGRPVFDTFRQTAWMVRGVLIHGGDRVSHDGDLYRVPKRDLVAAAQVPMQNKKLKIAPRLALADVLVKELLNFRVKIDPRTAHDSYSHWREQDHDDLVLAVCMAAWWAARPECQPMQVAPSLYDPMTEAEARRQTELRGPQTPREALAAEHADNPQHRRWAQKHFCPDCHREWIEATGGVA